MYRQVGRATGIGLAVAVCAIAAAPLNGQAPTGLSVMAALERYETNPGASVPAELARQNFTEFLRAYRAEAGYWVARADADARARRQRVAAALAVELVAGTLDGSYDEYRASRSLIEWFCEMLEKQPPTEFERAAMLASIAAAQGAGDSELLGIESGPRKRRGHIDHALGRFPGDDELRLARVVERPELRLISTVPLRPEGAVPTEGSVKQLVDTLAALDGLDGPRVKDEAQMRRAVVNFMSGRRLQAMQELGVSAVSSSRFPAYIANLMLGSIYYRGGDANGAAARYSKAISLVPATSARVGLAAALVKLGNVEEAAAIAAPRAAADRVEDPWRLYGLGLFHMLPVYLDQMRVALR